MSGDHLRSPHRVSTSRQNRADGRWYEAELLDQHRSQGRWRAVVRYSVAPDTRYVRAEWADELRRIDYQDMLDATAPRPYD